jgi:hypothetical protein
LRFSAQVPRLRKVDVTRALLLADSAKALGAGLVILVEIALGVLAIRFGRRRRGTWGAALVVVGVVWLALVVITAFRVFG